MAASHYRKLTFNLIDVFMFSTLTKLKLKYDSHLPKNTFCLLQWKSFKNDEKCFLFHLKSSFSSQDIYIFVSTCWSCRKNGLIRKIRLKLVSAVFYQFLFFPPNDSPLKTMKNAFYFIWKALFVLEISKFSYFSPPLFFSLLTIALEDDRRS